MIKVGDRIPSVTLLQMSNGQPTPVSSDDFFKGRKVALFGVPGAFTPTCSAKHLPSFLDNIESLKAKGVDAVACVAVNDVFVMDAWGREENVGDKIAMLADGSGEFAKASGLTLDLSAKGLGVRNNRFSAVVDDGVVKALNVEEAGGFSVSGGEKLLEQL